MVSENFLIVYDKGNGLLYTSQLRLNVKELIESCMSEASVRLRRRICLCGRQIKTK